MTNLNVPYGAPAAPLVQPLVQPSGRPSVAPQKPKYPLRFWLTLMQILGVGVFGWAALTVVITLFATGVALLVVAGIGLVLLVGLVYVVYGLGAFETLRVSGLYRMNVPPLRLRRSQQSGLGGYLKALGSQGIDGRMWVAFLSFLMTAIAGSISMHFLARALGLSIRAVSALLSGSPAVLEESDLYEGLGIVLPWFEIRGPVWDLVVAALSLAIVIGLVFLARAISIVAVGSPARAAALSAQAQAAEEYARAASAQARVTQTQREGAVRAADLERSRIERDLHDGVQPRLVSVGMTLGMAKQQIDTDPEKAKELITEAHTSTKAAITELRQLARGIHASVLDDRGLDAALSGLAGRSPVPVNLDVRLIDSSGVAVARVNREAEAAVYFAIAESLTNAAKHSYAAECRVTVRLRDVTVDQLHAHHGTLWARIEDNGIGGAHIVSGGGLDGIVNRITAAGGSARLESPHSGPTSLEVSVPCGY